MTHIPYLQPDVRPDNDCSTRLLIMGILMIVMGGFGACFSLSVPFGLIMMRNSGMPGVPVRQMMAGILFWPVIATMLIWTGIGSIQKRRWVRPIVLIFAWFGLLAGIISVISTFFAIPVIAAGATMPTSMPTTMPTTMQVSTSGNRTSATTTIFMSTQAVATPIIAITIITELLFGVGLPLTFLLLYRGQQVRSTLEFYDPTQRWTDARPIPVLGLAIAVAIAAVCMPLSAIPGAMFLFGVRVSGVPLVLVVVALAVVLAVIARKVYRLQLIGWQSAIVLICLGTISWITTLLRVPMEEIYRAGGMTAQQIQFTSQMRSSTTMSLIAVIWSATAIVFLLYTRRFFPGGSQFTTDGDTSTPPIET